MATLLEGGFLTFLTPIFIFIFIFVIFYALMEKLKFFGDKSGTHALIAFCLAILFIVVPETREMINFITPWFVVLVIFGLFIIMGLMFLGYKEESIIAGVTEGGTVLPLVIVAVVVLFLVAIVKVFGASVFKLGFVSSILNPKILGAAFILILAAEVVRKVGFVGSKD